MPNIGKIIQYHLLVVLFFAFTKAVISQDTIIQPNTNFEVLLNTKVNSASRKSQIIAEAPANVIVITSQQIENRGYLTIEDILKDLPGYDFSTGQPAGEYPTHFLQRGIGSVGQTKVALLIDGVAQNDVSNGWIRHIGYSFTINDIEQIEFISGPGSALYGGNAYVGYINIITKSALDNNNGIHVHANTLAGSFNTIAPELYISYKTKKKLTFQFAGRYFQSQGDYGIGRLDEGNYFQNNFEPDSILTFNQGVIANEKLPDGTSKPITDGYKTNIDDYYFRGKIENNELSINFSAWSKKEGLGNEVPGYEYFANHDFLDYGIHHSGKSFNLTYKTALNENISSKSRMYFQNNTVHPGTGFTYTWGYQSVNNGIDSVETDKKKQYTSDGFSIGIDQQINAKLSETNNLLVGFQVEQKIREYFYIEFVEGVPIPEHELDTLQNSLRPHSEYVSKNGAIFMNDEQRLFNHTVFNFGVRFDFDEFYGNILSPKLALIRSIDKGINYKVLLGKGYRPPSIFELYDEWRGNAELVPEIIKTAEFEFGYKQKFFSISSNIFYSQLNNIIEIGPNLDTNLIPIGIGGQHIDYYQNIGNKTIFGASISGNLFINKSTYLFGNYQYLGDADKKELDNVAAHKINLGINTLLFNKINFNIRGNWVGKTKAPISNRYFYEKTPESIQEVGYDYVTEENTDGFSDGFLVINTAVTGKNIISNNIFQIEPYLIIKNLLNTKYVQMGRQSGNGYRPINAIQPQIRNPFGFIPAYHPQPGIQLFVGVKIKFK